jgi:hypothetical protein
MDTLRGLWCLLFHYRWRRVRPAGMHCYDGHCNRCGHSWSEFE